MQRRPFLENGFQSGVFLAEDALCRQLLENVSCREMCSGLISFPGRSPLTPKSAGYVMFCGSLPTFDALFWAGNLFPLVKNIVRPYVVARVDIDAIIKHNWAKFVFPDSAVGCNKLRGGFPERAPRSIRSRTTSSLPSLHAAYRAPP